VTVTCDVTNVGNSSFTLVWVRRRYDNVATVGTVTSSSSPSSSAREARAEEEIISSNSHLEDRFLGTGRYSAKYEIVTKLTRIKFTLTITGIYASVHAAYVSRDVVQRNRRKRSNFESVLCIQMQSNDYCILIIFIYILKIQEAF